MSFVAAAIIGGGATLLGTGLQVYGSNKAKNDQLALAREEDQKRAKYESQANLDRGLANATQNIQFQQNDPLMQGYRDDYIAQLDEARGAAGNQLAQMQMLGSQGLPEASKTFAMQQANRAAGTQISAAEDARGGLGGAMRAQQGLKDTYTELASMDAQQRIQNKRMAAQAQGQYANQMQSLGAAEMGANMNYMNWQENAFREANIDPLNQEAAYNYGLSNRAQDYAAALQGSAMQNEANIYNQLGQGLQSVGGYGMGGGFSGMGGEGAEPQTRPTISGMPTIKTPTSI